jgi:hypothetical protein
MTFTQEGRRSENLRTFISKQSASGGKINTPGSIRPNNFYLLIEARFRLQRARQRFPRLKGKLAGPLWRALDRAAAAEARLLEVAIKAQGNNRPLGNHPGGVSVSYTFALEEAGRAA